MALGPQRTEDAVEQLEVGVVAMEDGLGRPGRPGRPHDERGVPVVDAVAGQPLEAVRPHEGGGPARVEHPVALGARQARVDRDQHGAGQPDAHHRRHELGRVGQLDGDGLSCAHARGPDAIGGAARRQAGFAGGDRAVERVQQGLPVGERVLDEQGGEAHAAELFTSAVSLPTGARPRDRALGATRAPSRRRRSC